MKPDEQELTLLELIDAEYTQHPFYGSRKRKGNAKVDHDAFGDLQDGDRNYQRARKAQKPGRITTDEGGAHAEQ